MVDLVRTQSFLFDAASFMTILCLFSLKKLHLVYSLCSFQYPAAKLAVTISFKHGAHAGTSPLYVFPNIFASEPSRDDVLGAMSLIFWILSIVVLVKYVIIVLHANDNGEGEHCSCIWQRVVHFPRPCPCCLKNCLLRQAPATSPLGITRPKRAGIARRTLSSSQLLVTAVQCTAEARRMTSHA